MVKEILYELMIELWKGTLNITVIYKVFDLSKLSTSKTNLQVNVSKKLSNFNKNYINLTNFTGQE